MALKIDLGCGASKKPGYIGVDSVAADGVDHVINIQHDPLPFKDKSVDEIYSSHCFEHIDNFILTFREISRISREGALLEFWTPHAWSNEGFMYEMSVTLPHSIICIRQRCSPRSGKGKCWAPTGTLRKFAT